MGYITSTVIKFTKAGFPATLEIRDNLENEFPFFLSVREHSGNLKKTPTIRETSGNLTVTQREKVFVSLASCVSCAICPSCGH